MKYNKRVFGVIDTIENLESTFEDILELSSRCKFSNCTHTEEHGCAVKKAISEGNLSKERFNNYFRMKREAEYVSTQKNKTKAIDYMKQKKLFQRV